LTRGAWQKYIPSSPRRWECVKSPQRFPRAVGSVGNGFIAFPCFPRTGISTVNAVFNRDPGGSTLKQDDAPKRKKRRRTSDRAPGCPRERGKVDGIVPGNLCRQRPDGAVGQHS
jgi:hypothetical protein